MFKIYTTYFANLKNLPDDILPLSISLSQPKSLNLEELSELKPTWDMLNVYKNDNNEENYTEQYMRILNKVNCTELLLKIKDLAIKRGYTKVALVCWEAPGKFCHRHIASKWLSKRLKIEVNEWSNI